MNAIIFSSSKKFLSQQNPWLPPYFHEYNCLQLPKSLSYFWEIECTYTELTFTLDGLFSTVHGVSHHQPGTACSLLSMAPGVLWQELISQPFLHPLQAGDMQCGASKRLDGNFQLNSRRVHLFTLICSTDLSLLPKDFTFLRENACFWDLMHWYFCHNSCCLQWVSSSNL